MGTVLAFPGPSNQRQVTFERLELNRIVDLYKILGYKFSFLKAPRMINCTGDRALAKEVLATRNL